MPYLYANERIRINPYYVLNFPYVNQIANKFWYSFPLLIFCNVLSVILSRKIEFEIFMVEGQTD